MFSTEIPFVASVPPVDSLQRFIPDLWQAQPGPTFPLNATWAHHGANFYFRPYDTFLRQQYGEPEGVEDYCMKAHLVTAEHHRAVSEAVNHRMWDITSGSWEWKINSSFPDIQWQIHDWYLRPMVSLYYYRLAFEPLHLQYSYLDRMVTVLNQTLQARNNLEAHAQVYSFEGKVLWEKRAPVNAAPNTYGNLFPIPATADIESLGTGYWDNLITPVYFLRLTLRDSSGDVVSRNFYWLAAAREANFRQLAKLPPLELGATHSTEREGPEAITRVKLQNATDRMAFFIHVAILNGETGDEVLPVRWDDNYFSLVPGESREVCARHASEDLKGMTPVIDIGGWNVLSSFESSGLSVSRTEVKPGQLFDVTAQIKNTGLDGSIVQLLVDGESRVSKRIWARGGQSRPVTFQLWLDSAGTHTLQVGGQKASVSVVG